MQETSYPEILRSKMNHVVLTLLKLNINNLVEFDYFDAPAPETLMRALELLNYLNAIDDDCKLTTIGYQMSEMPLEPQLSKMILTSPEYNCSNEMIIIVACLSSPQIFLRPRESQREADTCKEQFVQNDSDHITMMNAFIQYEQISTASERKNWCWNNFINDRTMQSIINVKQQLIQITRKLDLPIISCDIHGDGVSYDYSAIRKALTAGMFMQVAYRESKGEYITIKDNQKVYLHPSTVLTSKPTWVLYEEFVLTTQNYIRTNTVTDLDWLISIAPHYYDLSNFPECEAKYEIEKAYRNKAHGTTKR